MKRIYWGGVEGGGICKRIRCEIKLNDIPTLVFPISELYKKSDNYRIVPIHFIYFFYYCRSL